MLNNLKVNSNNFSMERAICPNAKNLWKNNICSKKINTIPKCVCRIRREILHKIGKNQMKIKKKKTIHWCWMLIVLEIKLHKIKEKKGKLMQNVIRIFHRKKISKIKKVDLVLLKKVLLRKLDYLLQLLLIFKGG